MKKISFIIVLFILAGVQTFPVAAQEVQDSTFAFLDSLEIEIAEKEIIFKEDTADFVYFALPPELEYIPGNDDPAVIADRLACIENKIQLTYNDKTHAFINYFTVKDREYTRLMMRRKNLYFPLFEKYLAKYGLPDELKYLSIIESGLNTRAVSRARAVGLWQFMSPTGKYYGLNQDWYIDERMDPEKATDAACRYLRDLYRMFNDWELALAAYNSGPGNVKKAIRKSGYKKTFWDIYNFVPRETRSYVPQFVAITYTMNYLDEHNFIEDGEEILMPADTILVSNFLYLPTFAELTGVCIEDLQKLNPSIQHNAIPDSKKPYIFHVPVLSLEPLAANRLAILDSASKVGKESVQALAVNSVGNTDGRDRIVYKVKSGDVLGSIAIRHNVRVNDIKKWNNLNSNTIQIGQRLTIWTRPGAYQETQPIASNTNPKTAIPAPIPGSKTYIVQQGDTLWDISRKFEGLSIERIKNLNNLQDNKIKAGQTLIIGD